MTKQETRELIYRISAAYPKAYTGMSQGKAAAMVDEWSEILKSYSYEDCTNGFHVYASTDKTGFPPVPGQIIANMRSFSTDATQSAEEAWRQVETAVRNSIYGSAEEFAKLPAYTQKVIGSPDALRAMACMDADEFETVEHSQFVKGFKEVQDREEKQKRTQPEAAQFFIEQETLRQLETKKKQPEQEPPKPLEMPKGMSKENKEKLKKFFGIKKENENA